MYDIVRDGRSLVAVGETAGLPWNPWVLQWDGQRWSSTAPPPVGQQGGLYGAAAIPGGGIWVAGNSLDRAGDPHLILARRGWNLTRHRNSRRP